MQPGDIVAFKGKGPTFAILSFILSLVEPSWRERRREWAPWHLATAMYRTPDFWIMFEAVGGEGNQLVTYGPDDFGDAKSYRFLPSVSAEIIRDEFVNIYKGWPYDNSAYFGVIFSWIWHKLTGKWWRVIDKAHMCWETAACWASFTRHPFQPEWEYPFLPRIIEKLEE